MTVNQSKDVSSYRNRVTKLIREFGLHHGLGTPSPLLPDPAFLGHCITGLAGQGDGIR